MSAKHVIVHGRVQGVFFRASAEQAASELGVAGWVRNLEDGSVELHVEGPDDAVDRMVTWARSGPEHAQVSAADVTDSAPEGRVDFTQV